MSDVLVLKYILESSAVTVIEDALNCFSFLHSLSWEVCSLYFWSFLWNFIHTSVKEGIYLQNYIYFSNTISL